LQLKYDTACSEDGAGQGGMHGAFASCIIWAESLICFGDWGLAVWLRSLVNAASYNSSLMRMWCLGASTLAANVCIVSDSSVWSREHGQQPSLFVVEPEALLCTLGDQPLRLIGVVLSLCAGVCSTRQLPGHPGLCGGAL
jgi:hypothetical protein